VRVPLIGGPQQGRTLEQGSCILFTIPEAIDWGFPGMGLVGDKITAEPCPGYFVHRWLACRSDSMPLGFFSYQGTGTGSITTGNDRFPYTEMPEHKERRKAMQGRR